MGNEIAQFREWDYDGAIEYNLVDEYDSHRMFQNFVKELNFFYLGNRELYEVDFDSSGFEWIVVDDRDQNILAFNRKDGAGNEMLCVYNFSPVTRENYRIGVDLPGEFEEAFSTDRTIYGGNGIHNDTVRSENIPAHHKGNSIQIKIPAYTALFIKNKNKKYSF